MRVFSKVFRVRTRGRVELANITAGVREAVRESRISEGLAVVFVNHTTVGLYINEDEPGLKQDLETLLEKLVPRGAGYLHDCVDNNAHAHLRSILLNHSIAIPISGGEPILGTWQNIFLAEFDGPRERRYTVQVIGE